MVNFSNIEWNFTNLENTIKNQLYPMYHDFMKCKQLPSFKINTFESPEIMGAFVKIPIKETECYTLNICPSYIMLMKERFLPILFHEFTHILDNETIYQDLTPQERNQQLKVYTEFHARIVQNKVATGFKSINEIKILNLNSNISDMGKIQTIEEFAINQTSSQRNQIIKNKDCVLKNISNIMNYLSYYLADKYFVNKYVRADVSHLFDISPFIEVLGNGVKQIDKILSSEQLSEVEIDFLHLYTLLMLKDLI